MGKRPYVLLALLGLACTALISSSKAEQCGSQAGDALCANNLCCSQWGWCGNSAAYCDPAQGCQSQCGGEPTPGPSPPTPTPSPPSGEGVGEIITKDLFDEMLLHRDNVACPARGFYTYDSFISAASEFGEFGNTGDLETRKREIAAFFGQTSHETTGGWPTAPDGPDAWGYCFKEEINTQNAYCVSNTQWPCVAGKKYYGRGPIQISYNYNYGQAGEALGLDLLSDPDRVATDPVVSFETALWFWMTPQAPKPSCHDVMTEGWTPSPADEAKGRLPGYGVTTNIINGGLECGHGPDDRAKDRIGFYRRYCDLLGVSPGDNLDCDSQLPFSWGAAHQSFK